MQSVKLMKKVTDTTFTYLTYVHILITIDCVL